MNVSDVELRANARTVFNSANNEFARSIHSTEEMRRVELGAAMAGMHILLEGEPGTGKTYTATNLGLIIGGHSERVQATPDLQASDLTGFTFFNRRDNEFQFLPGPLLRANVALVDEINRASSKTQSGLLEVMEEGHVAVNLFGETKSDKTQHVAEDQTLYPVKDPFFVIATQNPAELSQATTPLTKAMRDRFGIGITTAAMTEDDVVAVMSKEWPKANQGAELSEFAAAKDAVNSVAIDLRQIQRSAAIREALRDMTEVDLSDSSLGGARAVKSNILLAKSFALQDGSDVVGQSHLDLAALYTFPHRVGLSYDAVESKVTPLEVVQNAVDSL